MQRTASSPRATGRGHVYRRRRRLADPDGRHAGGAARRVRPACTRPRLRGGARRRPRTPRRSGATSASGGAAAWRAAIRSATRSARWSRPWPPTSPARARRRRARRARASSGSAAQAPPVAGGSGVEGADSGAVSGGGSGAGGGGAAASGVGPPAHLPPVAETSGAGSGGDLPGRPRAGRSPGFAGPVFAAARFRGVAVGRAAPRVLAGALPRRGRRAGGVARLRRGTLPRRRRRAGRAGRPLRRRGGRRARGRMRAGGRFRGRRGRRHGRVCDSALGGPAAPQAPGEIDAGAHRLPALRDRRTQEFLRCERHTGTMPGATAADTFASSSGPAPTRPARPGRPQAAAGGRSGGSRGERAASERVRREVLPSLHRRAEAERDGVGTPTRGSKPAGMPRDEARRGAHLVDPARAGDALAEVSKRMPATSRKTWPALA